MHIAVVTPPAPWLTLALVKTQLGVDHSEQDSVIETYMAAAMEHLDGPDRYLRRPVGLQVLAATVYSLPVSRRPGSGLLLPCPPVTAINDIDYIGADGEVVEVDPDAYELTADGRLQLAHGQSWAPRRSADDPITIKFTAGYAAVPKAIVTAALMHVMTMFDAGDEGAGFPGPAKVLVDGNYRLPRV